MFKEIRDRKILIVVAHPDDETLWFYQGIISLKSKNQIDILCLTYSADSERGKELLQARECLGVNVYFGNCQDLGMSHLLRGLDVAVEERFREGNYNLIITHPPHGGEKPHPHHIQTFQFLKDFTRRKKVRFSFFCEQVFMSQVIEGRFSRKQKLFVVKRIGSSFLLLKDEKLLNKLLFYIKSILSLLSIKGLFSVMEFEISQDSRKKALNVFKSQLSILEKYNSYRQNKEIFCVLDDY